MPELPVVEIIDPDLKGLLDRFFELSRADLQVMQDAVSAQDFDALVRLGHTAKGTGHGYGFSGMGKIGSAIEAAALSRDIQGVADQVTRLTQYLDTVTVEFHSK